MMYVLHGIRTKSVFRNPVRTSVTRNARESQHEIIVICPDPVVFLFRLPNWHPTRLGIVWDARDPNRVQKNYTGNGVLIDHFHPVYWWISSAFANYFHYENPPMSRKCIDPYTRTHMILNVWK